MAHIGECIILNNGVEMPRLGLGTSQGNKQDIVNAVKSAIDVGYKLIDCAFVYQTETEVGEAIREKITDGIIKREDIFVTSKLWSTYQSPDHVEEGLNLSLKNLQLDYLDLFLIHWPFGLKYSKENVSNINQPFDENVDYVDTWKALEKLYKSGLVKAIGISNFNIDQLKRLLHHAEIVPAVMQIECHPYIDQEKAISLCSSKGIAVTSYSPFASPNRSWVKKAGINVFEEPLLKDLATKYQKSVGQIILRYLIQLGTAVIPQSINAERIRSNLDVFSFILSDDDILNIRKLNGNKRIMPPKLPFTTHKHFPFPEEELLPL